MKTGEGSYGLWGNGTALSAPSLPAKEQFYVNLENWNSLTCGQNHACAINSSQVAFCWGMKLG